MAAASDTCEMKKAARPLMVTTVAMAAKNLIRTTFGMGDLATRLIRRGANRAANQRFRLSGSLLLIFANKYGRYLNNKPLPPPFIT